MEVIWLSNGSPSQVKKQSKSPFQTLDFPFSAQ